jgi:putative aminopeptidase FrvX
MTDLPQFLTELISAPGLSGYEKPISDLIETAWRPLTDEIHHSRLGSLHALKRGSASEPRPSLLFATHMDAIGLMVTGIIEEFLHVTEIGGLDPRVLPGQIVTVHGREDLPGIIVQPPAHLLPSQNHSGPVPLEHLLVDTGLSGRELSRTVRVGDLISFAQPPIQMDGELLAGHSLDNRTSVAALTSCLDALQNRQTVWDVWAVATTQEEETMGGASTSAFQIRPSLAVAIDVTFGASPGSPNHRTFPMGKGPVLGWGPNIHPGLHKAFKSLADGLEIPYKIEVMPRHSGTDAYGLQIAAEGIPTMVLSIPLRYMHTPVEMISMKDITRAGRLLAEFAASLNIDFMDQLVWDD